MAKAKLDICIRCGHQQAPGCLSCEICGSPLLFDAGEETDD